MESTKTKSIDLENAPMRIVEALHYLIKEGNYRTQEEIAKEIGDVLWYCATLSHDLGYKLEDIASMNYAKLRSRQVRNKLHGSGDNR